MTSLAPSLTFLAPYLKSSFAYFAFYSVSGAVISCNLWVVASYKLCPTSLTSYQPWESVVVTFSITPGYLLASYFIYCFPCSHFLSPYCFIYLAPCLISSLVLSSLSFTSVVPVRPVVPGVVTVVLPSVIFLPAKPKQEWVLMISRHFFGSRGEKVAFMLNPLTTTSKYYWCLFTSVFRLTYLTSHILIVLFIGRGK